MSLTAEQKATVLLNSYLSQYVSESEKIAARAKYDALKQSGNLTKARTRLQ